MVHFSKPSDNELVRELVDCDVVRKGLDGLETREGASLFDHLLLNADRINADAWLEWLTSTRGLIRIATLRPNPEWIGGLKITQSVRRMLGEEQLYPAFESAGNWVCGSLKADPVWKASWETRLGAKLVLIAPKLTELRELSRFYA